jgi:hypothetical protein
VTAPALELEIEALRLALAQLVAAVEYSRYSLYNPPVRLALAGARKVLMTEVTP